jgi:hypothetical protein
MILSHKKRWVRVLAAIPAAFLFFSVGWIFVVYVTTLVPTLLTIVVDQEGLLYTLPDALHGPVILHAALVSVLAVLALWSFAVAALTDPGRVPGPYVDRHRGLAALFRLPVSARPQYLQPQGLPRPGFGNVLPPFLRGRVPAAPGSGERGRAAAAAAAASSSSLSLAPAAAADADNGAGGAESDSAATGGAGSLRGRSVGAAAPPSLASSVAIPGSSTRAPVVLVRQVDPLLFVDPGPHDPRFCRKCSQVKPPRTHHCSLCGRCVLKMDHHCPWVGNCVGFGNYKAFFLLLLHGSAASALGLGLWGPLAFGYWQPLRPFAVSPGAAAAAAAGGGGTPSFDPPPAVPWERANRVFSFGKGTVGELFAFTLLIALTFAALLLFFTHLYLVLVGRTTLEANLFGG